MGAERRVLHAQTRERGPPSARAEIALLGLLDKDSILDQLFLYQRGVTTTLGGLLPGVLWVPAVVVGLPWLPVLVGDVDRLLVAHPGPPSPPSSVPSS